MAARTPADWRHLLWRRLRVLGVLALVLALAAGGVYLLAPQWIVTFTQWQAASEAGLETRALDLDGQHWVYYEGGSGPTIVLLHGFGGSRHDWVRVAQDLTPNFRVVIPDLPGWGDSLPVADEAVGPAAQATRLTAFIARTTPANPVLIGHSAGGLIAGLYAAAHPERVAALGFVDSAGVDHVQAAVRADGAAFAYTDRAGFARLLGLAFAEPPTVPGRIADVFVARNLAHLDWIKRSARALQRTQTALEPVLPELAKPVLVMWCQDDALISHDAVDVFRARLTRSPRIDVTTLFGCSHMPMREKPQATARAIARFMLPTAMAAPHAAPPVLQ